MNHTQKYTTHQSYNKRYLCPLALTNQGDFIAGFSLVAIHYFHVSLGSGDALVRHDTFEWSRMSVPAAACKVANVLRYEWNVMFW